MNKMEETLNYRPSAAAVVINSAGELLVCERIDSSGAWQFPQGGADEGENIEVAMVREVEEEIGLKREDYEILKSKSGYQYLFGSGEKVKQGTVYHGQDQTYFLIQVKDGVEPDVEQKDQEFTQAKWIKPSEFEADWLPKFKREVYGQVLQDFFGTDLV